MAILLAQHPFFSGPNSAGSKRLREAAEPRSCRAGETLFRAGDPSDALYLLLDGRVQFQTATADGDMIVSSSGPGEFFGEIGVMTGEPRALTAVAEKDCELARIPKVALDAYLAELPGPFESLLNSLVTHMHETTRRYVVEMNRQDKMALVGTMVNTIVHDFKNPFCLISLGSQMLAQRNADPESQRLCKTITDQVQRMVEMTTELSEFSKGKQDFSFRRIALRDLMTRFEELNYPFFEREGVAIDIAVPDVSIDVEPQRMLRVLQNLVSNALDALPPDGGHLGICAEVQGERLKLEITDTGCGIPAEIRDRFWEPFVTHGKRDGTGLGTAIVKSIVEGHNGSIRFQTEDGRGTTFFIDLPLRQSDAKL